MEREILSGVREALHSQGKRFTAQRALILKIIAATCRHLDADEIYRLAREEDPRLSLSTVYRTLNLLKEMGFIAELHFDERHHHYEIRDRGEHHHLICSSCGRIVEFESPLVEKLKERIGREKDFAIQRAHVDLFGLCSACRAVAGKEGSTLP